MRQLIIQDNHANKTSWAIEIPDNMTFWNFDSFFEFITAGAEKATETGFLASTQTPGRLEVLRQILINPDLCYETKVAFFQGNSELKPGTIIDLSNKINHIFLARSSKQANIDLISTQKRNLSIFNANRNYIDKIFSKLLNFPENSFIANSKKYNSFLEIQKDFKSNFSESDQIRFLYRILLIISNAPFESFSKILTGRQMLTCLEIWENISIGLGGICAEKSSALEFLLDILGIDSFSIFASDEAIKNDYDKRLKNYAISNGKDNFDLHIYHRMIGFKLNNNKYMTDVTGGNLTLRFLDSTDYKTFIKSKFTGRIVYNTESLFQRKVSRATADLYSTISEFHAPNLLWDYIITQGLGVHISANEYLGVYLDWGGLRSRTQENYFSKLAQKNGLIYPHFFHLENIESAPDEDLKNIIKLSHSGLKHLYIDKNYTGDFTFVYQPLNPNFWRKPIISESILKILNSFE